MKTSKDYSIRFKVGRSDYGIITVPKGTRVTHQTAMGHDENYHFVDDFSWVEPHDDGTPQYGLLHDLKYRGINVPKEFIIKRATYYKSAENVIFNDPMHRFWAKIFGNDRLVDKCTVCERIPTECIMQDGKRYCWDCWLVQK